MEKNLQQQIGMLRNSLLTALRALDELEQRLEEAPPPPAQPPPESPPPVPPAAREEAPGRVFHRVRLPACPHLKGRRGTSRAYASNRNVCWAEAGGGEEEEEYTQVEIEHQEEFCLTERYVECPRYPSGPPFRRGGDAATGSKPT